MRELTDRDIARWRLVAQRVVAPHAPDALSVVRHLLAVQAENPSQSAWAVSSRTMAPSPTAVADLLTDGTIVRTHVIRPTWFYVAAEDIGWLLDLVGSRAGAPMRQQLAAQAGIDDEAYDRAAAVVVGILDAEPDRVRDEVRAALAAAGFELDGMAAAHLLGRMETDQLIVSGRPRGGEHTYATFASRVAHRRRLDRDDALRELAVRYVVSHGPATARDLAYWATLTLTDARRACELGRDVLTTFDHDGRTFFHAPGEPPSGRLEPAAHLLQLLDELYRGFQDSRWVLDAAGAVPRARETAVGMALVDGQLVAAMKRTVAADHVRFDLRPYVDLGEGERVALDAAATRYGEYLGRTARVAWGTAPAQ